MVASLVLAGHAGAEPAFDAFAKVCGDSHMDYTAVAKLADSDGWKAQTVVGDTMDKVTISDKLSRGETVGGQDLTLLAWQGAAKGGTHVTACTVRISHPNYAKLRAAAEVWAGFAPQTNAARRASFQFTDTDGVRHAVAAGDANAAAAGSGLEIMTVWLDPNGAVLDLLKIKK